MRWRAAEDVTPDMLRVLERHTREYTPFEVYANTTTSITVNGSYGCHVRATEHLCADSGCGEPAAAWLVASATKPAAVQLYVVAAAGRFPATGALRARLPRPVGDPADFSPVP